MTPAGLLAVVLAWGVSVAGAAWWAFGAGQDREIATQAREERAADQAARIAADTAAKAISSIEVRNVTITKALEREVQTREVYRDCRSGADAVGLLNATPGIAAGRPDAAAGGELPASGAAGR